MYKVKIMKSRKITKGSHIKLRVESKVVLDDGFTFNPNFELSVTQTKDLLEKTSKKDIKKKLESLFKGWLKDNIEDLIMINKPLKSKTKVEEL